jgi:hypothetical protein
VSDQREEVPLKPQWYFVFAVLVRPEVGVGGLFFRGEKARIAVQTSSQSEHR